MVLRKTNLIIASSALAGLSVNVDSHSNIVHKPNILVIVCEDISPYLGCYGDISVKTPNLDNFARESILHTNMFTCVGVSSPSRYSLITGRYASTDGTNYMRANYFNKDFSVVLPDDVKCYTEFMRENGYYCTNNAKTDYQFDAPLSAWDEQGNKAHWKNTPDGMPFLSIFNLNITHESQIWKNTDKPLAVDPDKIVIPPYFPDNDIIRHDMAVMYTNITKMDEQFQALLNELEKLGEADNTIVIFYSDNGGPLPRGKREIKDSGTKVPFMIRFPDRYKAGTRNNDLNMFVDIPATILSLAGIETPSYMHGQAMYGKSTSKPRKYVFGATDRFDEQVEKRASIRTDKYLYIYNYMPNSSVFKPVEYRLQMPMMKNMLELYHAGKLNDVQRLWFNTPAPREELYDCINDPHQINNLAGNNEYDTILNKMRKAFSIEWINKYNKDWVRYSEADFVKKMWPDGKKPQVANPVMLRKNNSIGLKSQTSGASFIYQINGKAYEKSTQWYIYSKEIRIDERDTVKVKAVKIGYKDSEVVEY